MIVTVMGKKFRIAFCMADYGPCVKCGSKVSPLYFTELNSKRIVFCHKCVNVADAILFKRIQEEKRDAKETDGHIG